MKSYDMLKQKLKERMKSKVEQKESVKENVRYFENFEVDEQGYVKVLNDEKCVSADDILSGKVILVHLKDAEYRDIPADQINDVRLSDEELQDPERFWSQHNIFDETMGCHRRACKKDYLELASRIPKVYDALESGKTIDQLLQDPELKQTVLKYFDDNNMIRAVEGKEGVEMQSDGRHRILAARELNLKMPVKIVAKYQQLQKDNIVSDADMKHFQEAEDQNTYGLFW